MIPQFIEEKRPQIARLCRKYGVRKLWLIGSMARGDAGKRSDIDFLADLAPHAPKQSWDITGTRGLTEALYALFERNVDVISKSVLQPHWAEYVMNEAELYYVAKRAKNLTGHSLRSENHLQGARRSKAKAVSRRPSPAKRRSVADIGDKRSL